LRNLQWAAMALASGAALSSACGDTPGSGAGSVADGASAATSGLTTPEAGPPPAGDDGGPGTPGGDSGVDATLGSACSGAGVSTVTPGAAPPDPGAFSLPPGFVIETVAEVDNARELAALPNGDLLVGTSGTLVFIVPGAEAQGRAGTPIIFAVLPDSPAQSVAFAPSSCLIYVGTQHDIYSMAYVDKQQSATTIGSAIAHVRTGSVSPNRPSGDTDVHTTTSVAFAGDTLYAGVGSSCNACVESDPTRASIQAMSANGTRMTTRATRIRNAIALAVNPATGTLWAGGAGQDNLAGEHPYEFFDAVTLHAGVADYGWPECEENHVSYKSGADCAATVAPRVELPAYSTLIGAAFYPANQGGTHAFPATYRGGVFITAHGSWHKTSGGAFSAVPRVVYVPMTGDAPATSVDWGDPARQWKEFVGGFQLGDGVTRIGRPTGIAVGSQGSLFIADDQNGLVYRVRAM
jgi:glucose/arabinose dehydrogenase